MNAHRNATNDGYAARDLLAHPGCMSIASSRVVGQLTDQRRLPSPQSRDRRARDRTEVPRRCARRRATGTAPMTRPAASSTAGLAHDHPDDHAAIGAERHAHADLDAAARDHVGHHAVEPDRRDQHGQPAEEAGQRRHQPLAQQRLLRPASARSGTESLIAGLTSAIARVAAAVTRRRRRLGADDDLQRRSRLASCVAARCASGVNGSRRSRVLRVADHADDLVERPRLARRVLRSGTTARSDRARRGTCARTTRSRSRPSATAACRARRSRARRRAGCRARRSSRDRRVEVRPAPSATTPPTTTRLFQKLPLDRRGEASAPRRPRRESRARARGCRAFVAGARRPRAVRLAQVERRRQHAVLPEARIHRRQVAQAAREQQRADDQDQRQRDLQRRPARGGSPKRSRPSVMPRLPAFIVAPGDVRVARMRRRQAEQQARRDRHRGGEGEDAPVEREIDEQRAVARAEERDQRSAEPLRHEHAAGRADRGDQQALRQHLPDDAARATRRSRAGPRLRARAPSRARASGWRGSRRR